MVDVDGGEIRFTVGTWQPSGEILTTTSCV